MVRLTTAVLCAAIALSACGDDDLKGAPNVKGLALPEANAQLKKAGYSSSVKSDAILGVLVESNFTVCKVHSPNGKLVPLDVSKQC